MDLLRLDPNSYFPDELINNWSSLIWTERYISPGDFQLVTSDVEEMRALIPEGTLVSIRDSSEVMQVKTHEIDVDENGDYVSKISGRSVTSFLDERGWELAANDERWKMQQDYNLITAALVIAWNSICNTSGFDVTYPVSNSWVSLAENRLPNSCVTNSTRRVIGPRKWYLDGKDTHLAALLKVLFRGRLGFRAIRPFAEGVFVTPGAKVVAVSTTGGVTATMTNDISKLRFDVYDGLDRTQGQSVNTPVIFHRDKSDLEDPKYLFSNDNYKNIAWARGNKESGVNGVAYYRGYDGVPPANTYPGFNRYNLFVDVDARGSMSLAQYAEYMRQTCETGLDEHDAIAMYTAAISENNSYKYLEDYALGDRVTLHGDFGLTKNMVVSEYIRSEDKDGETAYPTLAELDAA